MKIGKDFITRSVAGEWVVVAVGRKSVDFHKMLRLNPSARLLWQTLEQGADEAALVKALTDKYNVSAQRAAADVKIFVEKLRALGCLEDEP